MQTNDLFAVLAIGLSLLATTGFVVVGVMLKSYRRNQRIIMGSRGTVDVAEHMAIVDDKLTNMRLAVEDLTLTARDHGVRIDGTLSHVGIVRFDAYRDLGGRQSTSVALVNSRSDGVVITTVVSRDFARMYVKLVKNGVGDIPLAPEENEAVQQAVRATPFVIRPTSEEDRSEESVATDVETMVESSPMVASLRGPYEQEDEETLQAERENRLRRRKGMPLVEHTGLAPSTQGWKIPETPAPENVSMAEQFLQQRKRGKGSDDSAEHDDGMTSTGEHDDDLSAETPLHQDDDRSGSYEDDDGWGFDEPVDDDTHEL